VATAEETLPPRIASGEHSRALAKQWRGLSRAATLVAALTSPALFVYLYYRQHVALVWALLGTIAAVAAFRGLVDLLMRRAIPWPRLFGTEEAQLQEEDVMARRRVWFWRFWFKWLVRIAVFITFCWIIRMGMHGGFVGWWDTATVVWDSIWGWLSNPQNTQYLFIIIPLFLINFLILFGPMMAMGISQMQAFEPGDAEWGVKLDDVRGQAEAKDDVRRVVNLWQSGEAFEEAGGKRERGLLFLGAPGTGKTMLSKAIATGFNCPFLSMPGSGFAQTFIGMDVVIVRYLAWKAKRLARKWGGQCIVFIDEIDAVGRRRQALSGGEGGFMVPRAGMDSFEEHCFYGPNGSLTPSGDLVLETRAWRERLFEQRAERQQPNAFLAKLGAIVNQVGGIGMMGGQQTGALNQLLVVMDGIDNPPFFKRFWTNRTNTLLDALYVIPRRMGSTSLRLPAPKPRGDQIYFIGATNVPLEVLDPALVRPGRMGRHVWFRTPTQKDRLDVFDLYITKVAHDQELDTPVRRDELARIANGYSPAMIQQVCSMALTFAHHEGRPHFNWDDIVEAMTTVESGTAINIDYVPEETRAVAIHEAGHAIASHVYMKGAESTRISIRRRGGALGHHQALEKEERFTSWRSEEMSRLIWTLGAMAAEHVFYGENATGVGGDLASATMRSAWMVGSCGMAPPRPELNGNFRSKQKEKDVRDEIRGQFREIGTQLMMRSGAGAMHDDQTRAVFGDPDKRRLATEFLGQTYLAAYHLLSHNKEKVEAFANVVIERKELYGNELLQMLDEAKFEVPKVDLTKEEAWPTIA
jgi:cell division protease FtsH